MRIRYLKLVNWLLASVMSVFGLQACHSERHMAEVDVPEAALPPMENNDEEQVAVPDIPPEPEMPRPREPEVAVYGVPTVDFAVKGRVTDAQGRPVKGVQVILVISEIDPDNLPETDYWQERMRSMSDTTDAHGSFEVRATDRPWEKMRVLVRDIDGKQNGLYQDQLVDVEFEEQQSGDRPVSKWKLGEKQAEVTVKLKKK